MIGAVIIITSVVGGARRRQQKRNTARDAHVPDTVNVSVVVVILYEEIKYNAGDGEQQTRNYE